MVAEVRVDASMRAVARLHRVSLSTVQWWVRRAGDRPLDKIDWGNRSPIAARNARTAGFMLHVAEISTFARLRPIKWVYRNPTHRITTNSTVTGN